MQYSTVNHLPGTPYATLTADYLIICEKNSVAARILKLFEAWTNGILGSTMEPLARRAALWMRNSAKHLASRLLNEFSQSTVGRALKLLVDLGFLEKRNNPSAGYDRTWQYRLNLEKVQAAINAIRAEHVKSVFEVPDADGQVKPEHQYRVRPETLAFIEKNEQLGSEPQDTPAVMVTPRPEDVGEVVSQYCQPEPQPVEPGPAEVELTSTELPSTSTEVTNAVPTEAEQGDDEPGVMEIWEERQSKKYVTGIEKVERQYSQKLYPWEERKDKRVKPKISFVHWVTLSSVHHGPKDTMTPIAKGRAHIYNLMNQRTGIDRLQDIYEEWRDSPFFEQEMDVKALNNPANHTMLWKTHRNPNVQTDAGPTIQPQIDASATEAKPPDAAPAPKPERYIMPGPGLTPEVQLLMDEYRAKMRQQGESGNDE